MPCTHFRSFKLRHYPCNWCYLRALLVIKPGEFSLVDVPILQLDLNKPENFWVVHPGFQCAEVIFLFSTAANGKKYIRDHGEPQSMDVPVRLLKALRQDYRPVIGWSRYPRVPTLTASVGIRPAKLPTRPSYSLIGMDALVAGYGVDYYDSERGLKIAHVKIAGLKNGSIVMDEYAQTVCYGDSGGPLLYCGVVVGVISSGSTDMMGRCTVGISFAIDVFSSVDWIRDNMQP